MAPLGYRLLGKAVWRGGRWYARRRLGRVRLRPGRRTAAAGTVLLVGAGVGVAVLATRGNSSS